MDNSYGMHQDQPIITAYVICACLVLLVLALIFVPLVIYSKKRMEDQARLQDLEARYENELVRVRFEVQDNALEQVSRDLHDTIGSSISVTRAYLNSDLPEMEKIRLASQSLKIALAEVRNVSKGLSLQTIRAEGLTRAIEDLVDRVKKMECYDVIYELRGDCRLLDEKVELFAFRIFQEAVTNILRHAEASRIDIAIDCNADSIGIYVRDNGKGFDIGMAVNGTGLSNMRTRAAMIGAGLTIDAPLGGGTQISLMIPIAVIE